MSAHPIRNRLLAGALVAGSLLGVPGVAMASTSASAPPSNPVNPPVKNASTFQAAKTFVEHQLTARQQRLSNLTAEVSAATDLTSSDRAALTTDLSGETSGIDALAAKVPGDTTWAELQADEKAMVGDYRVFVVMSPQAHLTIAADTAATVEQKLTAAEPQIEALINYEKSQGRDVAKAQTAYDGLVLEVSNAESVMNGVPAAVLAQSPSGYPANAAVFVNAHGNLVQARAALETARDDLHTIAQVLGV